MVTKSMPSKRAGLVALCTLLLMACGGSEEGARGESGSRGEQGEPGAAAKEPTYYTLSSVPVSFVGNGEAHSSCRDGDVLVAGGCSVEAALLMASFPEVADGQPKTWSCKAFSLPSNGDAMRVQLLQAYVVCAH
jgi:hypothetical protein